MGDPQSPLGYESARRALGHDAYDVRPSHLGNAEILLRAPTETWPEPAREVVVVAVCVRPFSNVRLHSRWNVFASNAAHAVAYSDGSARLVPPDEFRRIDLTGFVPVESWIPTW